MKELDKSSSELSANTQPGFEPEQCALCWNSSHRAYHKQGKLKFGFIWGLII